MFFAVPSDRVSKSTVLRPVPKPPAWHHSLNTPTSAPPHQLSQTPFPSKRVAGPVPLFRSSRRIAPGHSASVAQGQRTVDEGLSGMVAFTKISESRLRCRVSTRDCGDALSEYGDGDGDDDALLDICG
jgi:hypothetical protein